MTRNDGTVTSYGYDALNRRTSVSAGGLTQTLSYDNCTHGIGRLCSAADANSTTSYAYTPAGWLSSRGFSVNGTTYSLGYGYNALGQMTSVVYPDGNQALYTYVNGVVSAVQVNIGGSVSNAATAITYQPASATTAQWTSSNGIVNTLSYDTDGRLTGIAATHVQSLGFSYDAANRAYSAQAGHPFHAKPAGYSAPCRPVFPRHAGRVEDQGGVRVVDRKRPAKPSSSPCFSDPCSPAFP